MDNEEEHQKNRDCPHCCSCCCRYCLGYQTVSQRKGSPLAGRKRNLQSTDRAAAGGRNATLESMSEVRSFEITSPNNPTIYYYCTITSYLSEEPKEITGVNKTALSMVVDMDSLENTRDCKVGNLDAVMGEKDGFHYLCWTYSPKYSCVFKYVEGSVSEKDLFRMAESVSPLQ